VSDPPDPDRALPYAEVDVAQLARELRLTQPRFAGVLPDGREITLVAEAAAPDFETTDVIVTDQIEGRIAVSDDGYVLLDAGAGRIDMARRVADLSGGVAAERRRATASRPTRCACRWPNWGWTRRNACASKARPDAGGRRHGARRP
jgi:hypothetical protein